MLDECRQRGRSHTSSGSRSGTSGLAAPLDEQRRFAAEQDDERARDP